MKARTDEKISLTAEKISTIEKWQKYKSSLKSYVDLANGNTLYHTRKVIDKKKFSWQDILTSAEIEAKVRIVYEGIQKYKNQINKEIEQEIKNHFMQLANTFFQQNGNDQNNLFQLNVDGKNILFQLNEDEQDNQNEQQENVNEIYKQSDEDEIKKQSDNQKIEDEIAEKENKHQEKISKYHEIANEIRTQEECFVKLLISLNMGIVDKSVLIIAENKQLNKNLEYALFAKNKFPFILYLINNYKFLWDKDAISNFRKFYIYLINICTKFSDPKSQFTKEISAAVTLKSPDQAVFKLKRILLTAKSNNNFMQELAVYNEIQMFKVKLENIALIANANKLKSTKNFIIKPFSQYFEFLFQNLIQASTVVVEHYAEELPEGIKYYLNFLAQENSDEFYILVIAFIDMSNKCNKTDFKWRKELLQQAECSLQWGNKLLEIQEIDLDPSNLQQYLESELEKLNQEEDEYYQAEIDKYLKAEHIAELEKEYIRDLPKRIADLEDEFKQAVPTTKNLFSENSESNVEANDDEIDSEIDSDSDSEIDSETDDEVFKVDFALFDLKSNLTLLAYAENAKEGEEQIHLNTLIAEFYHWQANKMYIKFETPTVITPVLETAMDYLKIATTLIEANTALAEYVRLHKELSRVLTDTKKLVSIMHAKQKLFEYHCYLGGVKARNRIISLRGKKAWYKDTPIDLEKLSAKAKRYIVVKNNVEILGVLENSGKSISKKLLEVKKNNHSYNSFKNKIDGEENISIRKNKIVKEENVSVKADVVPEVAVVAANANVSVKADTHLRLFRPTRTVRSSSCHSYFDKAVAEKRETKRKGFGQ